MGKDLKGKELGRGLRQKKDGKYYARFVSVTGKRPEKGFEKLQDAKIWLRDQQYLDVHNNISASNNMTVDAWFNYWLDDIKKPVIRDSSYESYSTRYRKRIKPIIGDMLMSDVKPLHCQEVINEAQKHEKTASVEKLRMIMRQFFESAVDNDIIAKSPANRKIQVQKRPVEEPRVLSAKEQRDFTKYLEKREHVYRDQFLFILETGLRLGEMMGLKWEDIDFKKKSITVSRTLYYKSNTNSYVEHYPKTQKGYREIPLTEKAYNILLTRKRAKIVGQYVFVNSKGRIIKQANFDRSLDRVCKRINIDHISAHTLRHTFATRCIEGGMRPKTLQGILGHANLAMTMDLYVHLTEESLFEEMRSVEKKWGKNGENRKRKTS